MNVHEFVNQQTGAKFVSVLENAGVFKMDEEGLDGFRRFIRKFEETL